MKDRVLITGSHGAIGNIIRLTLERLGYNLVLIDKNNPENPIDILSDDVVSYFRYAKSVIHLAANPDPFIGKEEADKNIEITKKVIDTCNKVYTIKRIVNASSINIYPYVSIFKEGKRLTNTTPLSPNTIFYNCETEGHYGRAKIIAESLLEKFCREHSDSGIHLTNLRLGCVTKNDLPYKQEDDVIDPVDFDIHLKHNDLRKIIEKSLRYEGFKNYVCVSKKKGLVDDSIRFPI